MVTEVLDYALQMFSERSTEHMKEVLQLEEAVDQLERKLQKAHVKRLTSRKMYTGSKHAVFRCDFRSGTCGGSCHEYRVCDPGTGRSQ